MAEHIHNPDHLDIAILRSMYRGGAINLAGIDPRLNASRIAHVLRLGRARVAARLRTWREVGFLQKFDVLVNPAHFGWVGGLVSLRVDDPRHKAVVLQRASRLDGAIGATEFVGPWVSVSLVGSSRAALERRAALLSEAGHVVEVDGPYTWNAPAPPHALSPLDLRIVRALRASPTAALATVARRVGISTRTMTRRYRKLLDEGSVWFIPVYDFRKVRRPVVFVGVGLKEGGDPHVVLRRILGEYPLSCEMGAAGVRLEAAGQDVLVCVLPDTPAHFEEVGRFVESLPGVRAVETQLLIRNYAFPDWVDEQLSSLTDAGGKSPAGPSFRT